MAVQDDDLRQLKAKLELAVNQAERGELIDGEEAFLDLRRRIEERSR